MKVHHLNCGSIALPSAPLVCHVLLVETDNGLALVDSGFGLADCADRRRLGPVRFPMRPLLDPDQTAARQVERLGFRRTDVRHIILTHFDLDHIGGISDFPEAMVHCTADEALAALSGPSVQERFRYRSVQYGHNPHIISHSPGGESWRGFAAATELTGIAPGIVLVPLPGHSRGHACVAVDTGSRWILHCGDAFYHHGTLDGAPVPRLLGALESLLAFDRKQLRANQDRLTELYQRGEPDLLMVCAHDPTLLTRADGSG